MPSFSKEAEERLLNYVREAQGNITAGDSPNMAIVKVAREHSIHADMLPLMVQAINVGRQTYQQEKCGGQSILEKIADFPLANIAQVTSEVFPGKAVARSRVLAKQAEVSDVYSRPPQTPRQPAYITAA